MGWGCGMTPNSQCHCVPRPATRDGQCWLVNPLQMVCWGWCCVMSCGRLQVWMAATWWCHCPMEFTLCPPPGAGIGWTWGIVVPNNPQTLTGWNCLERNSLGGLEQEWSDPGTWVLGGRETPEYVV